MQTYQVNRDFAHNGRIHRKGETVKLSERQARYLLISCALEKHNQAERNTAPAEKSPKLKSKRASVKKKSASKRSAPDRK